MVPGFDALNLPHSLCVATNISFVRCMMFCTGVDEADKATGRGVENRTNACSVLGRFLSDQRGVLSESVHSIGHPKSQIRRHGARCCHIYQECCARAQISNFNLFITL